MTFKLDEIINTATDYLTDNKYLKSPVWAAFIIVIILLLTVWFVFKNEVDTVYDDTSMLHLYAKIGIWSILSSIIIIFLHNRSVKRYYEEKCKNIGQEQTVRAVVGEMEPSDEQNDTDEKDEKDQEDKSNKNQEEKDVKERKKKIEGK